MSRLAQRWAWVFCIGASVALVLFAPADVFARAGGGGGGGGGGDGDIGILIYYWVRFSIAYPYIGIPVTIGGVAFLAWASYQGNKARQTRVIRRGMPLLDVQRTRLAVAMLRDNDPDEPCSGPTLRDAPASAPCGVAPPQRLVQSLLVVAPCLGPRPERRGAWQSAQHPLTLGRAGRWGG